MNRPKNKRLECLKKMPPLAHSKKGKSFDIMKSDVVNWMVTQPEVRQWLFDKVTDKTGRNPEFIKYNSDTHTWQGIDYDDN